MQTVAIIILAAGKGTRMKSETAKVLHQIAGRPMIMYVVDSAVRVAGSEVIIVVGTQADQVRSLVSAEADVRFAHQEQQLGTGHAVFSALPYLSDSVEHVVILCGDAPLIKASTLTMLIETHLSERYAVTVLGARLDNPYGYGRLVENENGDLLRIVEEADASAFEKKIKMVNTGIYCVNRQLLSALLGKLSTNNAQNEMYLTDIVGLAVAENHRIGMIPCSDSTEILGVNTQEDLVNVEALI